MLTTGSEEFKPKPYIHYKNSKFTKHTDLLKSSLRQIRSCSLNTEDKATLLVLLADILTDELEKIKLLNNSPTQKNK